MGTVTEPPQLSTIFSAPISEHPKRWDSCYRDAFHPWDRAGPSFALADLLIQRADLVPPCTSPATSSSSPTGTSSPTRQQKQSRSTALVPGCGLGHDALLLASFGYDVWAVDVSGTALEKAKAQQREAEEKRLYPVNEGAERGSITWVEADFFSDWATGAGTDGSGKFDLIFDYTFLCALPLQVRPQWAKRISELIRTTGRLVCLEFPVGKPHGDGGPPWGLHPEVYEALLAAPGEPIEYDGDGQGTVVSLPSPKPRDNAIHRLSLIKPPRTHKAGTNEDGSVRDFISVWSL